MAVLSNAMWRTIPGRAADFIKAAGEAKTIHERLGARAFAVQWSNSGANSGAIGYGLLFPDQAAWAKLVDAVGTDPAWLAFAQKYINVANPPATLLSQSVAVDQPGFEAPDPAPPGTFVFGANAQVAPGRVAADVLRLMTEIKPVVIGHGAQWMRLRRVTIGGETTLAFVTTLGFANATAYAAWQAKFSADPRGLAFQQAVYGPGSPLGPIGQATGVVLSI